MTNRVIQALIYTAKASGVVAMVFGAFIGTGFCAPVLVSNEALMMAVTLRDIDRVRHALENGADPNFSENGRPSALAKAVISNSANILGLLLQSGGDPNQVNDGMSLLILAAGGQGEGAEESILQLLRHGANIEATDTRERYTPLISAATLGSLPMLEVLLQNGANPNNVPKDGFPALLMIKNNMRCNTDCVELLLSYGANPDLSTGGGGLTYRQLIKREGNKLLIDLINLYFPE
jgi:ankyrin repeat protein